MKKTYRIKTNNQELLISKQNEFDATSRWIEFQKTRLFPFTINEAYSSLWGHTLEILSLVVQDD